MLSLLRNRFGIPGAISVIALVFAMFGGAYAASNDGGGKATASAKAKKGPRGPKGAKGDTGPAGPAGPAGAQGPAGANGKDGSNGTNGSNGANGKSVTVTELGPGECNNGEGGAAFSVGSEEAEACNGKEGEEGPEGPEGSPWTAGGTLPSGKTETGSWALGAISAGAVPEGSASAILVPISFAIQLSAVIPASNVHFNPVGFVGTPGSDCPGKASAPAAKAGHLCVYSTAIGVSGGEFEMQHIQRAGEEEELGSSTTGALLTFAVGPKANTWGTWAVTAP